MTNSIQSIRRLSVAMVMDQEEMLARMQIHKEQVEQVAVQTAQVGKDGQPNGELYKHTFVNE